MIEVTRMEKIKRFEELKVWQESTDLAVKVYKVCENGTIKNDFGLRDQLQRAVISISSNIAEGFEYNNNKNFIRFLYYSKGSCGELRSQWHVLYKLKKIETNAFEEVNEDLISLSRRIAAFINYLKKFEKEKGESQALK